MFGLLFFFAGCGGLISTLFGNTYRRRKSFYTLTNKRAFIATDMPFKGRTLNTYQIASDTPLEYIANSFPTIFFASKVVRNQDTYTTVQIGFERIHDGEKVFGLMRDIQQGQLK